MARPTLSNHPKFRRLSAAVGSSVLARGILETLWDIAYEAGDPVIGSAEEVETLAQWQGAPGALANALWANGRGFFDVLDALDGPALYSVHDLEDHAPDYVLKRWQREEERRRKGQTIRSIRQEAARRTWSTRHGQPPGDQPSANVEHLHDGVEHMSTNVEPPSRAPSPLISPPVGACDPPESGPAVDQVAREVIGEAMKSALEEPRPAGGWRQRVFLAAASPDFLSCFERYPNGDGQSPAAQTWQEIALTFEGGEAKLKAAILARFDAGMLKRNPYNQARYCPKFERFLAERRWEDREPKPDEPAARDGPGRSRDQPPPKPLVYASLNQRVKPA